MSWKPRFPKRNVPNESHFDDDAYNYDKPDVANKHRTNKQSRGKPYVSQHHHNNRNTFSNDAYSNHQNYNGNHRMNNTQRQNPYASQHQYRRHYHPNDDTYKHRNSRRNDRNQYRGDTSSHRHTTDNTPNISKNNKHVKYVENTGKWNIENVSHHALADTLQAIWNTHYHKNVERIQKIVLLCGPPGSGKTSVCGFVEKYYVIEASKDMNSDHMIDVSSIMSDVIKHNNGNIIMHKVYEKLLMQILQNKNKILIIDGFLRKEQHVYVLNFLKLMMKQIKFILLVMDVTEQTSVKRQLERGQRLLQLSKINSEQKQQKQKRLKDSDLYEDKARIRYQKYNRLLGAVRYQLKRESKATFDIIDANQPLQSVFWSVQMQLKKQDSQIAT